MTAGKRQRTVCSGWRQLFPAAALALILVAAPRPAARSNQPQQKPPESLSAAEFSRLIRDVSEEGGYFLSLLQRMSVFLADFDAGRYQSYVDLISTNYIAPDNPK